MFQQCPQHDVNGPIPLHDGRFLVRSGDHCNGASGSAHLRWLPTPGIEFVVETDAPCGFDLDSLTVEVPGFRTKKVVAFSTQWGSKPSGSTRICAFVGEMEWGGEQSLFSVGFQIVNFPDVITPGPYAVPGDPTAISGNCGTTHTVSLNHDGWQFRIVAVPESGSRREKLKATGGYAFTHVGQLKRVDNSAFSLEDAKHVLDSLRHFLTFARGAACALPIQWGRGEDDEIVWRRFQSPVVDPWRRSYLPWIGEGLHTGGVLAEVFDRFCRTHDDSSSRESLVLVLHWYRHCNTQSSGLEGSFVLGMAALELLGALIVVDRDGAMSAGQYDRLSGSQKLRKLLEALNLLPHVPQRYEALSRFAKKNGNWDSAQALAELRNGFVHAKEERRRIVFGSDGRPATPDALQLSLWYQELALLRLLEYRGSYFNRTTASWVTQVESVPWSQS